MSFLGRKVADINQTYSGTVDQLDPDVVIMRLPGVFPWSPKRLVYLPDEIRQQIRQHNADATTTANGVKTPFTGTTNPQRITWLNERLTAVNARVAFIQTRTGVLLESLKKYGSSNYDLLSKAITTGLAAVPVIGSVVSYAAGRDMAAQAVEEYRLQTVIRDYATDLQQLAVIRQTLQEELAARQVSNAVPMPISNAPTANNYGLYLLLAFVAVLVIYFIRRRNNRRTTR